jgi:phosphate starvation-inducible PhoH-like protein
MSFRPAEPRSWGQEEYLKSIDGNTITICTGFPGTGKTFLALSKAVELALKHKKFKKVVIIRPYMPSNTGERLGSLPGTLEEKVSPYLESIKDNLLKLDMSTEEIRRFIRERVEFTVLSMCRGRSFANCVVIVEEAQNVPLDGEAMKMLFTRVGDYCKLIVAGDLDQCDINKVNSGLSDAIDRLWDMNGVGVIKLDNIEDIQRSPLIAEILRRYEHK